MILNQDLDIERFIGEAIGAASVCWGNIEGAGEFQSELAGQIVDEIMIKLSDLLR